MSITEVEPISELLKKLTGQEPSLPKNIRLIPPFPQTGLGYSQLNELLLMLGYDRVTQAFFQLLVDDTLAYQSGSTIGSIEHLEQGIERVRELSLLFFGNVKFGFKKLARDERALSKYYSSILPIPTETFMMRHVAIQEVDLIASDQTYYLGYVVQREIEDRLLKNPDDEEAKKELELTKSVKAKGIRNHQAYLVSDHLDVYVATSMRRRHEYAEIAEFTNAVFSQELLSELKLRWFDPTQAYCSDRIDKGLAEALMLKRAVCTLYLAQETDTLGKDSELASTLAQGKPVIAYVPSPLEDEIVRSVSRLAQLYSRPEEVILLERLQVMDPSLAWTNPTVRTWIAGDVDRSSAMNLLVEITRKHYDTRAKTLKDSHPLGIQVNLETGVANGVLVVRSASDCALLIRKIVTRNLKFRIERKEIEGVENHLLRETVSESVFRVMTGDAALANSFWNFYLAPPDQPVDGATMESSLNQPYALSRE